MNDFAALPVREMRLELEGLYAEYTGALDEERFEDWAEFFTEDCFYQIIPRENHDLGLPVATWRSESKAMLHDRVTSIRKTAVYAPRYLRRYVTGIRPRAESDGTITVRANYLVVETLLDELSRVFNAGYYLDEIVGVGSELKFARKVCVFDSVLVPNSLIYPL